MEQRNLRVPSVSDYINAFRAIEPGITAKQREMLLVHHAAPARVISATRLAEAVGFENYNAVNLQYGSLAREMARELNLELGEFVALGVLVDFVHPDFAANEHYLWVLRPNVAQALEDLGWAPRVSHLLYPGLEKASHPTVKYPEWAGSIPHTDANAQISSFRSVKNVRAIHVKNASYRNATLTGTFEIEDQSGRNPIETTSSGKQKVRVICAWHGVTPSTTYPQLDVTNAEYNLIDDYIGEAADNIS